MDSEIKIAVKSYVGYKGVERPCSFTIGDSELNVEAVIDQWFSKNFTCFMVGADDGNIYILKCNGKNKKWDLEFFQKT